MHQSMKLNDDAEKYLAMQQIQAHNDAVLSVQSNSAFDGLSPPPSSFGGFSATLVVALFFDSWNACAIGLTYGHFPNKITRFRQGTSRRKSS